MQISKLKCVRHCFAFNDGSEVVWHQADFRVMNKHGWGCCADCWEIDLPNATAANTTYIPSNILAAIHNDKRIQLPS